MTDFFRDQLNNMNRVQGTGFAQGGWDIHNKQYVVSIYQNPLEFPGLLPNGTDDPETYKTLSFDSGVSGWTTFFSYKPDQILSLRDKLYTLKNGANLVNNSLPSQGEIIFGESISGIKGYYSTVTMSTDTVTNLGGEKELFSVGYSYIQNSGF